MKTMKKWFLILAVLAFCVSLAAITAHAAENTEYYVAGTAGLCGSMWDPSDPNNQMVHQGGNIYTKTYENVPAGIYEFKVTDGSWNYCWGDGTGDAGNCKILVEFDNSTVIIGFDSVSKGIWFSGASKPEPEPVPVPDGPFYVAGSYGLCGSHWDPSDPNNQMVHEGGNIYTKTYKNVPEGMYQFKVTAGTWSNSWGNGTDDCWVYVEEGSTVTICFDSNNKTVTYSGARTLPGLPRNLYVAGPASLCGDHWYAISSDNLMTMTKEGVYAKVYKNINAGSYELRVTEGNWEDSWGAADSEDNFSFTVDTHGSTVTVFFDPVTEIISVGVTFPEGACAHVYNPVVTPPTCEEEGYTTFTCGLCGYKYIADYTGYAHEYDIEYNLSGCGVEYDLYTCVFCGDSYTDPYYVPKHQFSKVVTPPTPEVNGYTTYTCNKCDYTYTDDETVYEIIGTGVCGDDVTWTLGNNGVVTISGTGDMYDFERSNSPWYRCANAIFMPITKAVISDGVTSIGNYAFDYLSQLKEINLPEGITRIGKGAFCDCGMANLELPDSLREIGKGAFEGAQLTSVTIPKNVTSIGSRAFYYCRELKTVTISDGVTVISEWMFNHCTNLESITIPASVTVIGGSAFYDCLRLTDVHYGKGEKDWEKISIDTGNTCLTAATIHYKYVATPKISALENKVDGVRIAWDAVPAAAKYKLVVKTATSAWKTIGYTTGTSFTWPRATSGVTYTFGIRCVTADGKEYTSDFDSTGKTIKYVAMPTIATAESAKDGVKLTWNAVPGAEKYKLMVKTDSGWKTIWNTVKTTYTWPDAQSGKTYTFAIRCTTADGKSYTSAFDSTGKTIQYIARPTVKKLQNTANGIWINWDAVPGAVKYKIVVKTATSGWKTLGYSTGTSFTWPRATSGVTYTFAIRCVTSDGKEYTSAFDSTGKTIKFVACPAIASLENTKDGIKVTWNKVAGAEKYKLVVKTDSGWKTIWNTVNNSYVWTDAVGGETYTFSIRCMTADGKNYTSAFNSTGWTHTYTQKIDG